MPSWDATQYLKFKAERTQPAEDLARQLDALVSAGKEPRSPRTIMDIGCGPGNSTAVLQHHFPDARILGVDSSPEMISAAEKAFSGTDQESPRFACMSVPQDIRTVQNRYDIVFSNACIQWIPEHETLIPALFKILSPGGILAVQIPVNYCEPIHRIITEVSALPEWSRWFPQKRIFYTCSTGEYFDILSRCTTDFRLWETIYCHRLASCDELLEWYRGTGLRPYLDALPPEAIPEFEQTILSRLQDEYPQQENGEILFRFPRLFFTAVRQIQGLHE
jgi:trans-aconitate 2-methyltransferase